MVVFDPFGTTESFNLGAIVMLVKGNFIIGPAGHTDHLCNSHDIPLRGLLVLMPFSDETLEAQKGQVAGRKEAGIEVSSL